MFEKYITTRWDIQGLYRDSFIKVAQFNPEIYIPPEISSFTSNFRPDPRFCHVHVIAATDGMRYGPNLNGDILDWDQLTGLQSPEEALNNPDDYRGVQLPRYKTFEQAKFYRHHANNPEDPFYGDVPVAALNIPMRRIELIIRIYRQDLPELGGFGAPDIIAKLDRRGYICVSMGCKIHHETCEYCGRSNELIADRCPCLKNNMNVIMPDGRQVRARNFGIRFFDISDVGIAADPAALSLQKVASFYNGVRSNPARDILDSRIIGAWAKMSELTKNFPPDSVAAVPVTNVPPNGMVETEPVPFDPDLIKTAMSNSGSLDCLVSTMTAMGIVLSPHELVLATSIQEPEKLAQSAMQFDGIRQLLLDNFSPSLYYLLSEKTAGRSGFIAACPSTGWQPTKIAEAGYPDVARYYSYYRGLVGSVARDSFVKVAYRNNLVRELLGSETEHENRVQSALYYLAHAGMTV